jgi:hypothetical protein
MAPVTSVSAVVEQVHQRARRQQQVREEAEKVGAMLAEDEERSDGKEDGERNLSARIGLRRLVVGVMIH